MPKTLADLVDLPLALKRVKIDLPKRVFVQHPYEMELIDVDRQSWLDETLMLLREGRYRPQPLTICDVPKGKSAVRPGAHFRIRDNVVYAALVGACFPQIHRALQWANKTVDFSYPLPKEATDDRWISPEFTGWKAFQDETIRRIDGGASFVICTDITGYYENVDLSTLMSDLRHIGAPRLVVDQLSYCLNFWAQPMPRGIPQGHAPSDILGKLYLDAIDSAIVDEGFTHTRYVDDFRLFCDSLPSAKRFLLRLTQLLRQRGLTLQNSKTEILEAVEARNKIEALRAKILDVRCKLNFQVEMAIEMGNPYIDDDFPEAVLNDDLESPPDEAPLEAIKVAFAEHFCAGPDPLTGIEQEPPSFDVSLFHFLIKRLGKAGDGYAAADCIELLGERPEETKYICQYLAMIERRGDFDGPITRFLESSESIYPYQCYQLIEWRLLDPTAPIQSLLVLVRNLTFDGRQPSYLQAVCRRFMGTFGTRADLDKLAAEYPEVHGELEQCEILCSIARMETGRRNAFYGRHGTTAELHERAVKLVKQRGGD